MRTLSLAWRQLRRDLAAGDIRILFAALVLAVVAVTSVGFVTDRAGRALAMEANRLLGGDALVRGDAPIGGAVLEAANAPDLQRTETVELDSMIRVGSGGDAQLRLGDLRALGERFPLRGAFRIVGDDGVERDAGSVPEPGTLWLSRAGADTLGARVGDRVGIGTREFRLAALVAQEPDASIDYFNVAPKAFLNLADLPSTGLVQEGSRLRYRLVVAGDAAAIERFATTAKANLARGQRIETITDARPEVRSALDRAGRFLGLAALVSVILAAVAVAMAARRHSERHLSGVAVMRCLWRSRQPACGRRCAAMASASSSCSRSARLRCWRCGACRRCACCAATSTAASLPRGSSRSRPWAGSRRCCGGRRGRRRSRSRCWWASRRRWRCWRCWRGA